MLFLCRSSTETSWDMERVPDSKSLEPAEGGPNRLPTIKSGADFREINNFRPADHHGGGGRWRGKEK